MTLRSALDTEVVWAVNALTVILHDDSFTAPSLAAMPVSGYGSWCGLGDRELIVYFLKLCLKSCAISIRVSKLSCNARCRLGAIGSWLIAYVLTINSLFMIMI